MSSKEDYIISPLLNVKAKFFLTETGENYFINKNIPIRDLVSIEGKLGSGFIWGNYKSKIIEKFIVGKLIHEIDIDRTELTSRLKDILELSKLVYFSMLYKKFRPELTNVLYNSDMLEQIKQENPQIKITKNIRFNSQIVKKFLSDNADAINAAKDVLKIDAFAIIDNEPEIIEKQEKKKIVISFIEQIDQNLWFLFHFLSKTGNAFDLMKAMNEIIVNYTMKSKIFDKLNLLLKDILDVAEKAHFNRLGRLKKTVLPEIITGDLDSEIMKPGIKDKLVEYAKNTNANIHFYIKFPQEGLETNNRLRLTFNLSLRGNLREKMKKMKVKKSDAEINNVKEVETIDGETIEIDDNQGFNSDEEEISIFTRHFNSLKVECAKEKIKFVVNSDTDEKKEESYVVITLQI